MGNLLNKIFFSEYYTISTIKKQNILCKYFQNLLKCTNKYVIIISYI